MKRVFSCFTCRTGRKPYFRNNFISEIYEGIHMRGGEVLTMNISCISEHSDSGEHLLITYEDHGNYEAIDQLLFDKKDDVTKLLKEKHMI